MAGRKFKVGTKVRCTSAASFAYRVGEIYDVVETPEGKPAIKARDGILDLPSQVISKFEPVLREAK